MSRLLTALVLAASLSASALPVAASGQALTDYSIKSGHYYSQANGTSQGPTGGGFSITDDQNVPFWTYFDKHGGVEQFGYPISRRFIWGGRITQVTQRAVFQWNSASGQVELANVFDYLSQVGKDDWLLAAHLAPKAQQTPNESRPLPFLLLAHYRFAWLRDDPAFFHRYFVTPDYYAIYGLPTSSVQDLGPYTAIRFQRVVMYHWKSPVPWGDSQGVSVGLAGDVFKHLGFVPPAAAVPENATTTSTAIAPTAVLTPPVVTPVKASVPAAMPPQVAKLEVAARSPSPAVMAAATPTTVASVPTHPTPMSSVTQVVKSASSVVPFPTTPSQPASSPVRSVAVMAAVTTRSLVVPAPSPTATPTVQAQPAPPSPKSKSRVEGTARLIPAVSHSFKSMVLDGVATWYGAAFQGRAMSNGQRFDMWNASTAAANVFPLGTRLRVTRRVTGHSIIVTVTDHGAFSYPDLVDLSYAAFSRLADPTTGVIGIQVVPVADDGG